MSFQITIIENNEIKGNIDLYDITDFPFAFTIDIADISNISTRAGGVTKTFKVPATKNNIALLEYYNIISSESDTAFNRTTVISLGGVVIEEGPLRVKQSLSDDSPKEYDLLFYSNNNDWHELMANFKVNELSFNNPAATLDKQGIGATGQWNVVASTDGVFTNNRAHMEASWFGTYDTAWDYVYSLKSFGQATGWRSGGAHVRQEDMRPDIYARSIIREAFKNIGWTVESTFFDSADFKKLVIPCTGDFVHNNNAWEYSVSSLPRVVPSQIAFILGQDLGLGFVFTLNNDAGDQLSFTTDTFNITTSTVTAQRLIFTAAGSMDLTIDYAFTSGNVTVAYSLLNQSGNFKDFEVSLTSGVAVSIDVEQGDYLIIAFKSLHSSADSMTQFDVSIDITKGEFPVNVGETYDVGYTLPQATALEFITGVFQLFNIYFWADAGARIVHAEPRESFFRSYTTSAINWTDKIDMSSLVIKSNSTYKKEIHFDLKEDNKDGYVKSLNENQEKKVGSFWYKINDKLKRGVTKFRNQIFSYTDNFFDTSITPTGTVGVRIPRLWKDKEQYPEQQFNYNFRILYYDGYVSQGVNWFWSIATNQVEKVPYSRSDKDTFKLDYDVNDGLVETYYKNTISTINDNRIVVCSANLSPTDMNILDFRNPIYLSIDGLNHYYYINKIIDYQPNADTTTKIELIPIIILYNLVEGNIITGEQTETEDHKMGVYSEVGKRSGTVLKNGTTSIALNGSVAVGINLIGLGEIQTIIGRYNLDNSTDIIQIGVGTPEDRRNAFSVASDGEIKHYGGEIYTTEGIPVMYAKERENDIPVNIQKIYKNG